LGLGKDAFDVGFLPDGGATADETEVDYRLLKGSAT
jgi:hypothetical protein